MATPQIKAVIFDVMGTMVDYTLPVTKRFVAKGFTEDAAEASFYTGHAHVRLRLYYPPVICCPEVPKKLSLDLLQAFVQRMAYEGAALDITGWHGVFTHVIQSSLRPSYKLKSFNVVLLSSRLLRANEGDWHGQPAADPAEG